MTLITLIKAIVALIVEVPRFELGLTEPKSVVLPLHHTSIKREISIDGIQNGKERKALIFLLIPLALIL